jgi:hypothetical protein
MKLHTFLGFQRKDKEGHWHRMRILHLLFLPMFLFKLILAVIIYFPSKSKEIDIVYIKYVFCKTHYCLW